MKAAVSKLQNMAADSLTRQARLAEAKGKTLSDLKAAYVQNIEEHSRTYDDAI